MNEARGYRPTGRGETTTVVERNSVDYITCMVAGYVLLIPSLSLLPSLRPYVEKRVLQIGLLVVVGGVLVISRSSRKRWLAVFLSLPRISRWGLGVVLSLGLWSSATAPVSFYAFVEVGHFVLLFAAACVVASAVRESSERMRKLFLGVIIASVALYGVYFAVGYSMHLTIADIQVWPKEGTNFDNIRFLNQYQTWTLPLLGGGLLFVPERWRAVRGFVFSLLVFWWALIFASDVRGTVVAIAIAAVGVGLLFRNRAKMWLFTQTLALIGGVTLYYLLFSAAGASAGGAPPAVEKFGSGSSVRLQHWRECLEMVWDRPWLGVGPMHFAWPPYQFTRSASPHNAFMQWLAEWGVISTAIMSLLTVWGGWRWMRQEEGAARQRRDRTDAVSVALVAAVLAGAAHSMVSGIIVSPLSQVCLTLVGGWAWGRYQHNRQPASSSTGLAHAVLCVTLIASIGIVGGSLNDLSTKEKRRAAFVKSIQGNHYYPRYWLQGYIGVQDSSVLKRAGRNR